jgi:putative ATPase
MVLKRLSPESLHDLVARAQDIEGKDLLLDDDAKETLISMADGDGRCLLNLVEEVFSFDLKTKISSRDLAEKLQKRSMGYDKDREEHYNLISALHKSVRGSDPDAALYWFARMLEGGEDPLFLARRLVRMASEEIAIADPTALMIAGEAARTYERLGSPEGELALAHAVVHLATAPKSNAVYVAYKAARRSAKETGSLMPPAHILNAPTSLMSDLGYGSGYKYDHDQEDSFSGQNYFPDDMERQTFYQPKEAGREKAVKERLKFLAERRNQNR